MHHKLRNIDLNLLLTFDAIYRHGMLTEASDELSLSPSALSHALSRLRETFDDPLFVRRSNKMQPTLLAVSLSKGISSALNTLTSCLNIHEDFSPENSHQTFIFSATDYTTSAFFPSLISKINEIAHNVKIKIIYSSAFDSMEELNSGKIDFAVGFQEVDISTSNGIQSMECFDDEYVVAVRKNHPFITHELTLENYLKVQHVVVKPWNEDKGFIDKVLERENIKRKIAVELPSLLSAPIIVSKTNLAITLPLKGFREIFNTEDLVIFKPPLPLPGYTLKVYYNQTLTNTKGHDWMKGLMSSI